MLASDLTKGMKLRLPVIKDKSFSKYYYVATDDREFRIRKLKWQLESDDKPDFLDCYVSEIRDGVPFISQNLNGMIPRFYTEGERYEFKVASPWGVGAGCYTLKDNNGLSFTLRNAPANLRAGAVVVCSVETIRGCEVMLKYRGQLSAPLNLAFVDMREWLDAVSAPHASIIAGLYLNFMRAREEFADAVTEYDNNNPDWIFTAIAAFTEHIPYWLEQNTSDDGDGASGSSDTQRNRRLLQARGIIETVLAVCGHIVEDSDYLRGCNLDQRVDFRDRLTNWIELLKQYSQAVKTLSDGTYERYIGDIFRRLRESGNLYHPSKRFRILMTIFRLRPSLIVERMAELFEILHKWERANWEMEPFRGALVGQLELFIHELGALVDNIAANETGRDNKLLVQMILAIAIQSLLARDDDDADLDLNRAKLYRYMSCLNPAMADSLLDKAVGSLLGMTFSGEFNWADTGLNPSLLIEKTSCALPDADEREGAISLKRFTAAGATVELRDDSVKVLGQDADPAATSLPNGTVPWLGATVSVADDVKTPGRKNKGLRPLREMWNDVERSLFSPDSQSRVESSVPRRLPDHREMVCVTVDDARIFRSASASEPTLRFHCVIDDDSVYGDGWMTAHINSFLPWLSAKDVECGFYDLSLDFARDGNGNLLLFQAEAMVNGDDLTFSMRKPLNDYFIDIAESGQESLAFITCNDRQQQAILAVSELGYTLQLPFSDKSREGEPGYLDTDSLQAGDVVRVKCIQRSDRGNALYMEGEILESIPGKRISKADVLRSVLHGLGQSGSGIDQETSEVTEAEEIMTRGELYEIAQLFRRKAWLEKDFHTAFNLLAFARVLARCGGFETLARDIRTHQDLLGQLEYFANNRHVDPAELEEIEPRTAGVQMLERLYRRLHILSVIGHPGNNPLLWNNLDNYSDDNRRLASLVLSYNLLPKDELNEPARKILERIAMLFNVIESSPNLKYYGQEGPRTEFKSSIVFTNRKQDKMRPHHEAQLHEILEIICGFMNYEGGTLYIGVNDAGYEAGLAEDLDFFRRIRPFGFPGQPGTNASLDNMEVYLSFNLRQKLPAFATNMGKIEIDSDSRKGVLVVTINPSRTPVYLDGVLYARDSTSTTARTGQRLDDFLANRERNYDLYVSERQMQQKDAAVADDTPAEIQATAKPAPERPASGPAPEPLSGNSIATGRLRNNVVDEWEDGYSEPEFVLHLRDRGKWKLTLSDVYCDADTRLRLAVHSDETDGHIVCIDSANRVSRLPMERLMRLPFEADNSSHRLEDTRFLLIGRPDAYLLCVARNESTGKLFYRLTHLADVEEVTSFDGEGKTLCDQPHTILAAEIVGGYKALNFQKGLNIRRDQYGIPLRPELNETPDETLERFLSGI